MEDNIEEETIVVTVRVPKTIIKKLDELAKKLGFTRRAEIIRQALREYIENHS